MPSSFTDRRPAASSLPPLGLSNVAGRLPSTYSAVSTAGMQYTHVGQQLQSEQQQQNIIRGGNLGSIPNSHGLGMSPVSAGLFSNANSTYTITPQSSTYPGSLQTSQFAPLGQSLSSMAPQPVYPSVNAPNRNYSPLDYLRNATSPAVNDGMALPPPPPGMDSSSAAVQANQQSGLQVLNSLPPLQQQAAANSMMAPPLSAALSSQSLRSPPLLGFGSSGSSNNFSPRQPTTPYSAPPYTPQHGTQFFPFNFAHSASSPSSLQDIKFNTSISNGPAGSAHPIQNSLGAPNPQAPPLAHAHSYQGGLHQYRMRSGGMNQSAMGHPVMTNLHMPGSQMSMIGGMTNGALGSSLLPQGLPSAFAGQSNVMNDGLNTMRASSVVQGMSGIQYGVATPHNLPGNPGHGSANHINGVPTHRPFQCNECSQGFNRNHDLKRHKRIHLAVKPFPCGHCPKSFSRKDALKVSCYPVSSAYVIERAQDAD